MTDRDLLRSSTEASVALAIAPAQAGFSLDGGTSFAVLYEGNGGNTLNINNGPDPITHEAVNGNIGVGNTERWR